AATLADCQSAWWLVSLLANRKGPPNADSSSPSACIEAQSSMLTSAEEPANELAMLFAPRLFLAVSLLLAATMLAPADRVMEWQSNADAARAELDRPARNETRRIVDARTAPYSAVGRLKGTMLCTGAVV